MRNFLVILLLVIQNCTISKQEISITGNYEPAIKNTIIDFRTSSLAKRDSAFLVRFRELDGGIIGVSLYGTVNKFRILKMIAQTIQYFHFLVTLVNWLKVIIHGTM